MLKGKAHITLNSVDYIIDEGVDDHYVHKFQSVLAPKQSIAGSIGKENIMPEKLLWSMDDWSGGEGAYIFDPRDPNTYDYSTGANGRIKGQLTGKPNRTQVQVTAMGDNNQRCYLCMAQGRLWIAGDEKIKFSTDYGATWSAPTGTLGITAGDNVSGVAGDDRHFYYTTKTGASTWEIRRIKETTNSDSVVARGSTNPGAWFVNLAMFNGKLYGWTGRKLYEFDVFETLPLTWNNTYRKVYDTGVELDMTEYGGSAAGSWWGDVVAGENAIFFFAGTEGRTTVYVFRDGVGRPLWNMPIGLTGKSMKVESGTIYVAGHWGGEGSANGFACMYALPLRSLTPQFVGWFRKTQGTNLQAQEMANSYAEQILVGMAKSGRVFVYDREFNAVSLLDDFAIDAPTNWSGTNSKIGDMVTIGPKRIVAFYNPGGASGTTYETLNYANDETSNRESDGSLSYTLDGGEWDYAYPNAVKSLMGFYVTFKVENTGTTSGLLANQRITVKYAIDGGSYTTAGTVTSTSPVSGSQGRVWIAVATGSTSKKFFRLRPQVVLDNNATDTVKPPILYGVTAESELLEYVEMWDIVVRTKVEDKKNARPLYRSLAPDVLRDNLEKLMTNKSVVTFLDGYREREAATYTTHTVIVERLEDNIKHSAQGSTRVRLRAVPA